MKNQKPSFEITNDIICQIAEIAELVGKLTVLEQFSSVATLHHRNRIRMIHGSLALEQNALTLEQAAAVLNGQKILGPPKDLAELQNTWSVYEHMEEWDPFSIDALREVHKVMLGEPAGEAGVFRSKKVNVVDESGQILHFGTLPDYYSKLASELLDWVRDSDMPMLVKSCVFRYEFERIHPFSNGTGRIGRLWHTLLLMKWNPLFAWVPVDTVIQEHQSEYYKVINAANDAGNATGFIRFMHASIISSLKNVIDEIDQTTTQQSDESDGCEMSDETGEEDLIDASDVSEKRSTRRWDEVRRFLCTHELVRNADIRTLCGVSSATANRILAGFAAEGRLVKCHEGGHWGYRLKK